MSRKRRWLERAFKNPKNLGMPLHAVASYSNESLLERVSVSRETEFCRQRQRREMALRIQFSPSQRPSARPQARGLFAKSREISVRLRLRGGAGRSPTLGEINGLQMVRVEITPLNAKEDFAATRTLRLDVERRITPRSEPPLMEAKSTDPAAHIRNERATFMLPLAPSALRGVRSRLSCELLTGDRPAPCRRRGGIVAGSRSVRACRRIDGQRADRPRRLCPSHAQ
jgi:hypothetical protein